MTPPAIVLDTNVFVAAGFNAKSASARIIDAVKKGQIRMIWNDATRREIEFILQRIPPLARQPVSALFRPEDRYAGKTEPERFTAIPDPEDRKFAALTHAAGVPLISQDAHLLKQREYEDLMVLTPGEFWKRQQRPSV